MVTVIVITYNRASTLDRALRSILAQTHTDLDVVIVDDGSTDGTKELLKGVTDSRVRVFRHERNRGITAARNTGLDAIKGEWFTFVDSDDEIVPDAVATLVSVVREVDPLITHVECNCIDADTGAFTGEGLDRDQPLDEATIVGKMRHDHWGIMRSDLLGEDRFNENLPGYEDTLWTRVRRRAKSYYLHKGLKIVYRGGADRASVTTLNNALSAKVHKELLNEGPWLENTKAYRPGEFQRFAFRGMLYTMAARDRESAQAYYAMLDNLDGNGTRTALARIARLGGPPVARIILSLITRIRSLKLTMRNLRSVLR
jgi:glycosyltransferase involved in cell wall biosynthesis